MKFVFAPGEIIPASIIADRPGTTITQTTRADGSVEVEVTEHFLTANVVSMSSIGYAGPCTGFVGEWTHQIIEPLAPEVFKLGEDISQTPEAKAKRKEKAKKSPVRKIIGDLGERRF